MEAVSPFKIGRSVIAVDSSEIIEWLAVTAAIQ
jgi:hypothetical protein